MTLNNPAELQYDVLEPGNGPQFGVTANPSTYFPTASRGVTAWFTNLQDAKSWAYRVAGYVWDLEAGERR